MSTKHKNTVTELHILSKQIGIQNEYIFVICCYLFSLIFLRTHTKRGADHYTVACLAQSSVRL